MIFLKDNPYYHDQDTLSSLHLHFYQIIMTSLLTSLRRFTVGTTDDETKRNGMILVPHEFIDSVQNWDDKFGRLLDGNEWLESIDKDLSDSDLSVLRHAFLADGHGFMNTLSQYLKAVMWQEFVAYTCTQAVQNVPVLMQILWAGQYDLLDRDDAPESPSKAFKYALDNLKGSQVLGSVCIEAIRRRYCFEPL